MKACQRQPSVFLRIFFTALLVALLGFIFSNSLQTGEESSSQSGGVVELVQKMAMQIAPNSFVATATGEDYDTLHALVRMAAHFLEFCALGAVMVWCLYSYTLKKRHAPIAFIGACITACLDELLQTFTQGRGAEIKDIIVDCMGGAAGCIFAVIIIVFFIKVGERYGKS